MKVTYALLLTLFALVTLGQSNYTYNGSNNNLANPLFGQAPAPLIRIAPIAYGDGFNTPRGGLSSTLPSPRLISNIIFSREASGIRQVNPRLVTDVLTYWGQFVDHDLDHSPDSNCDPFRISVPKGDFFYDVTGTGNATMNFCRTIPVAGTGTNATNIRLLPNNITPWLDASMIYGNNEAVSKALRTFKDGMMKTDNGPDGPLCPANNNGTGGVLLNMANAAQRVPANTLFAAGDVRANENPVLACVHSLFVREHNRRAALLPKTMSDEEKFQTARRWIIAHFQAITFNEYLPTLLGQKPPAYVYNASLNPQVSVFFSTVSFRYGHDEVSGIIARYTNKGLPYKDGNLLLRDGYFFPPVVTNVGIGPYLRGIAVNQQNAIDAMLDEDVRTYLFHFAPALATDLAARNIQRARDHGVPDYNSCRKAYGLPICANYSCINPDPKIVNLLAQAYGADGINIVDPFVGGLLEVKNAGSNLGPLFTTSILEQLVRSRNADRFWYQNAGMFSKEDLAIIENTKFSDIIQRNTDTPVIPKDVFTRQNVSPSVALGAAGNGTSGSDSKNIIGIIIPSVIAAILLVIIIGMCFVDKRKDRNFKENNLYENLIDKN